MNPTLSLEQIEHWTPEQAWVVYDFCQMMSEALWREHEETLMEKTMEQEHAYAQGMLSHQNSGNLELPFEDDTVL